MKYRKIIIFFLIIILLGILSVYYDRITGNFVSDVNNKYEKELAFVIRIIDGDTISVNLNNSVETIRFLGINTPEKGKPYYSEAKDYLKEIENKSIEVLRDFEDVDKYDRKLRYVFYENRLVNAEILEQGLATSFMIKGLNYENKLKTAEDFAKNNEKGLWDRSSDRCSECIKLAELNSEEEFFIIENNCDFNCDLEGWEVKDDANHFFKLNDLNAGSEERYDSKTSIWNNDGDRFFMRDNEGKLVVFYEY